MKRFIKSPIIAAIEEKKLSSTKKMLNRRLLRVKVMQAIYALKQSRASNYFIAQDYITETFSPDLNSMEQQDPALLKEKREKASEGFKKLYREGKKVSNEEEDITEAIDQATKILEKENQKDRKHFLTLLEKDINRIYQNYLQVLLLLVDLADYASVYEDEKKHKFIKENEFKFSSEPFGENLILRFLSQNKALKEKKDNDPSLEWDQKIVRKIFKSSLIKDEQVLDFLRKPEQGIQPERQIALHILKNVILKDKRVINHFEEIDINWSENKKILKGMVVKTIKALESPDQENVLLDITGNWEEDKDFFISLYKNVLDKDEDFENVISEKTKNWDIERIALIDKIMLKMALTEMVTFPSIPVKVTINEYIELSKLYSTPKSKQFINGLLDKISLDLINKGIIKKSGRGLIDNK